ncbi:MAG TPA: alanine--glyoxylate aminotransferase [Candidatus Latescibacteria bacterium]|nr:alanine--glyoxylate aminotransferase [Candidatus Latescibacterota bacterium]
MTDFPIFDPPERLLMGPGPSNIHPRVYAALSAPVVGHLDPVFLAVMEEAKALLRATFQTRNELTIAISGTGSAGMETCFVNAVEPGDRVLVCINGVFGMRMREVATRCGAEVDIIEAEWGTAIPTESVAEALSAAEYKVVAVVHAETSTGVLQPLEQISRLVHDHGALFLVDAVTSLGGVELDVDGLEIDLCYSGTQKCLSCPPGLSPVTFSTRAMERLAARQTAVQSWYLDLSLISQYWGESRVYHHTAPISMNYALREALRLVSEEGLEARWSRHLRNQQALVRGLEALGLSLVVDESIRLPALTTVRIPQGIDDANVRGTLLQRFGIEIGGGLGAFQGKAWRVGLMGSTSTERNVTTFLAALQATLAEQGYKGGGAVEAALSA